MNGRRRSVSSAVVIMALAALLLPACSTEPEKSLFQEKQDSAAKPSKEQFLKDGQSALDAEAFGAARDNYMHVLALDPQDAEAKIGLGEAFLGLHQSDDALVAFDSVVSDKNFEARALQGKGIAWLMQQKPNDAALSLIQATKLDPSLWRSWNALGQLYDSRDDWNQARQSYEAALKVNPRSEIVQNNLGVSLLMQGKYQEALPHFSEALKIRPDFGMAKMNLRLVLAWQGKYTEAKAGVAREELPMVLNNIGYVAILRGDYDVADAYLNQAIAASPSYFTQAQRNLQYLESIRAGNSDLAQPGKLVQ